MTSTINTVRTRMAPSPTGNLHVGTAHTTIFNYLFAKHNNGTFLLRIDDTDIERSSKEFEADILAGLSWLGITSDEPLVRQSERSNTYKQFLIQLLSDKKAFWCGHTEQELTEEREKQMQAGAPLKHVCGDRDNNLTDGIIRFKNDFEGKISFDDLIRGPILFDASLLGDFSLAKDLDTPLYNFANVVDDYDMRISHVIRGEDHIANTPKQILIQKALNISQPLFAHLPLLLGTDRSKLSKRHAATSVSDYRDLGYLPDAMCNYLALLGWNPGTDREIFSLEQLIKEFSLEKVQKAGAIFDIAKLDWMNGEYIRQKTPAQLRELATPYVAEFSREKREYIEQILILEQPRLKKLSELPEKIDYFFNEPVYDKSLLAWKLMNDEDLKKSLSHSQQVVESISEKNWDKESIEAVFLKAGESYKNRGELLWPLRAALSGKKASPGPFDILAVLGKEKTLLRIQKAISML